MILILFALAQVLCATAGCAQALSVPNGDFESVDAAKNLPEGWIVGIGGGARAVIAADSRTAHSGHWSLKISNQSALQAFVYADAASPLIAVQPQTTYVLHFFARGQAARGCHAAISFEHDGEFREDLPAGDFEWQPLSCQFTTPGGCTAVRVHFASDDVTGGLWIDDVSLERSSLQLVNLAERRYPKPFDGIFPRSRGAVARRLVVYDASREKVEIQRLLAALQGLVNRDRPRLYLLNATNPAGYDAKWQEYLQQKGYTGSPESLTDLTALLRRFRSFYRGAVVIDPDLPGSVNAAFMLAGLLHLLPTTAELAAKLGLPVQMDLRGRWKRNVDAYRFVYDRYWDRMNHHILAWSYPLASGSSARDYMVEFNIFSFWVSSYADHEKGADPPAEEAFLNELLANTPANIPVMGWPNYSDHRGISEYTGVRWLSEYGKFVPGTEFCSNLSVHTAVHPPDALFRQKSSAGAVELKPDRVYLSVNILDSGDGLWYWQFHQRTIWADPDRGRVPVGWCMNVTLYDMLPDVLQWYYENATPQDSFFAAVSGLGYMNTQVYASRFRPQDRERIWREYVQWTDRYCRKLDIHGIELYDGGWGEPTPPAGVLERFAQGIKGLDFILADLGRHDSISPANANSLIQNTAVFHTLTRFQVWSSSAEVYKDTMTANNTWLLGEIRQNTPQTRPAFLSAMAISWIYKPSWLLALQQNLPAGLEMVSPADLARLYRRAAETGKLGN